MGLNRDKYGIIGQIQPGGWVEGGDSVTWMGHWLYLNDGKDPGGTEVKNTKDYINFFEVAPGGYVRHPKPEQTYNGFGAYYRNPWMGCMSRDQLTGVLAALVKGREYKAMLRFLLNHSLKLFLLTNKVLDNGKPPEEIKFNLIKLFYNPEDTNHYQLPDLTLFNMWAMMLRGFGKASWIFWPLLCICDIHLLIDTVVSNNQKDEDDKINYCMRMLVANDNVPTPVSKLAVKILKKGNLLAALKRYWCGWRDNCDMYAKYEEKVMEL